MDNSLLAQPFSATIHTGNPKIQSIILEKLVAMVPNIYNSSKPQFLAKYILPISIQLLDEKKSEVRTSNCKLIQTMYNIVGKTLLDNLSEEVSARVWSVLTS